MTAVYPTAEEIAASALQICDDLRTQDLQMMLRGLARECSKYPVRMAQIVMALAIWVDYDGPISVLEERAQALIRAREIEFAQEELLWLED